MRNEKTIGKITEAQPVQVAVAYVRMSTDQQRYSIHHQMLAIKAYALAQGLELRRVYEDAGKSGLRLQNRAGLKSLLSETLAGTPDFSYIIVYDVSRWGRFQDVDEAAHYEHLCRRSGIRVVYCAEPFDDDNSPLTAVIKSVKRAMAGEYSRELSAKVFAGLCHVAKLGFANGGGVGLGLQRVVLDENGHRLRTLAPGQRKSPSEHSSYEPGPREEIVLVRRIFHMYVEKGMRVEDITRWLNRYRPLAHRGRRWYPRAVNYILLNEKYIGTLIYNRTSGKLRVKRVRNDPELWIRVPDAFPAIIDPVTFWRAQEIWQRRHERKSDQQLLAELKAYVDRHGVCSSCKLADVRELSSVRLYGKRFGSLRRAYDLIGYTGLPNTLTYDAYEELRAWRRAILLELREQLTKWGGTLSIDPRARNFMLNDEVSCYFVLVRERTTPSGASSWPVIFRSKKDIYLIGRLPVRGETVIDYFVIPESALRDKSIVLYRENGIQFEQFRAPSLDGVLKLLGIGAAANAFAAQGRAPASKVATVASNNLAARS